MDDDKKKKKRKKERETLTTGEPRKENLIFRDKHVLQIIKIDTNLEEEKKKIEINRNNWRLKKESAPNNTQTQANTYVAPREKQFMSDV